MKNLTSLATATILLISCGATQTKETELEQKHNEPKVKNITKTVTPLKEIEREGCKYIGETKTPAGIWDTLMRGYADRTDGNYFNKTERFNALQIKGYEFE